MGEHNNCSIEREFLTDTVRIVCSCGWDVELYDKPSDADITQRFAEHVSEVRNGDD